MRDMPPEKISVSPPKGGWKAETWYRVRVSMNITNPVFDAVLYTGFLKDGLPSAYSGIMSASTPIGDEIPYNSIYYMAKVEELFTVDEYKNEA